MPEKDARRDEARARAMLKSGLTDENRETAIWLADTWKAIADRKEEEARAAYALAAERAEQLAAMTAARDHCKAQTAEVGERLTSLLAWLRESHPDAYVEAPGVAFTGERS